MTENKKPDRISAAGKSTIKAIGFVAITAGLISTLIILPTIIGAAILYFWPDAITPNNHKFGAAILMGVFGFVGIVSAGGLVFAAYRAGEMVFSDFEKTEDEA